MAEQDIPHGHGLSYKKGISDGLLDKDQYKEEIHETHCASYRRGVEEGIALRDFINSRVKQNSE